MQLNSAQNTAVQADGVNLVIAGPGTGKTEVLGQRVKHLIQNGAVPNEILCLTFTDAGVTAMQTRLARLKVPSGVQIFTFHAWAAEKIQEFPEKFPNLETPMDEIQQILLIENIVRTKTLKILKPFGAPFHHVRELSNVMSELAREGITPELYSTNLPTIISNLENTAKTHTRKTEREKATKTIQKLTEIGEIFAEYVSQKTAKKLYDFDDMILKVLHFLRTDPDFLTDAAADTRHILIDEFQDLNGAQNEIFLKIAGKIQK